jgi:uncharacterized iron-regulated membrane protein
MSRKPVRKFFNVWSRKLHRWGAIATAMPLLVIIVSGLFLQWKKDVAWIQPPTMRGVEPNPTISFDAIIRAAQSVPEAGITSWDDVDRLDVRPGRGVVKVRGKNRWEVQVDSSTGEVLQVMYRRSDLIEQIHDGSWFHDYAKHLVFFPAALIFFGLLVTGLYLWILPIWAKSAGRRRRALAGGGA